MRLGLVLVGMVFAKLRVIESSDFVLAVKPVLARNGEVELIAFVSLVVDDLSLGAFHYLYALEQFEH